MERISNVSIIPAKIKHERYVRDSIKGVKDSLLRMRLEREQKARIDSTALTIIDELPNFPVKEPAKKKEHETVVAVLPTERFQFKKYNQPADIS
ncbi:MAG: hypothetical protein IPK31_04825 [Chitinophagaceae bacterium]|nr:hypothetical protein [Chitinophagaceae bacterium]